MKSKILSLLALFALSGSCLGGFASLDANPLLKTHSVTPLLGSQLVNSFPSPFIAAAAPATSVLLRANEAAGDPQSPYNFSYGILNALPGDVNDYKRIVTFPSDQINNFNAVVSGGESSFATNAVFAAAGPGQVLQTVPNLGGGVTALNTGGFLQGSPFLQPSSGSVLPASSILKSFPSTSFLHSSPILKTYSTSPFISTAPAVVNSYASTPFVHAAATPVVSTYATPPFVHSTSVYKTYSTAPTTTTLHTTGPILPTNSVFSNLPQFPLEQHPFTFFTPATPGTNPGQEPQDEVSTEVVSEEEGQTMTQEDSEETLAASIPELQSEEDNVSIPIEDVEKELEPESQEQPGQQDLQPGQQPVQPPLGLQPFFPQFPQELFTPEQQQFLLGQGIFPPFPLNGIPPQQIPIGIPVEQPQPQPQPQPEQPINSDDSDTVETQSIFSERQQSLKASARKSAATASKRQQSLKASARKSAATASERQQSLKASATKSSATKSSATGYAAPLTKAKKLALKIKS